MARVFLADSDIDERSAIRRLLDDLRMEVVGEADNWQTVVNQAPHCAMDMLLIDWHSLPKEPCNALTELRKTCPSGIFVVLISPLDARQQAATSLGADLFISKLEAPAQIARRLREAMEGLNK